MWTEITALEAERDGHATPSDLTDREWELIEPFMPPAEARPLNDLPSGERDRVSAAQRLSLAPAAEGFSAAFDGAALTSTPGGTANGINRHLLIARTLRPARPPPWTSR